MTAGPSSQPDLRLLPGLFARVRLRQQPYEALLLPDEAIGTDQTQRFAFVVNNSTPWNTAG